MNEGMECQLVGILLVDTVPAMRQVLCRALELSRVPDKDLQRPWTRVECIDRHQKGSDEGDGKCTAEGLGCVRSLEKAQEKIKVNLETYWITIIVGQCGTCL